MKPEKTRKYRDTERESSSLEVATSYMPCQRKTAKAGKYDEHDQKPGRRVVKPEIMTVRPASTTREGAMWCVAPPVLETDGVAVAVNRPVRERSAAEEREGLTVEAEWAAVTDEGDGIGDPGTPAVTTEVGREGDWPF